MDNGNIYQTAFYRFHLLTKFNIETMTCFSLI